MKISGERGPSDSPCSGVCSTASTVGVCLGCGRTDVEVIEWNSLGEEERININNRIKLEGLHHGRTKNV